MSSDNAVFDADVYQTQKTAFSNRKLTFSSKKNITKIEFEGGENLALLTADSFDASTGVWSGKATDIRFTISSKGLVKFTKVTVTLDDASNVVDSKNIFTETFDKMNGKGGNDGNFNVLGSPIGNLSSDDCDNAGWSYSGRSNGKADKCVRIEMSASLTTPALANL